MIFNLLKKFEVFKKNKKHIVCSAMMNIGRIRVMEESAHLATSFWNDSTNFKINWEMYYYNNNQPLRIKEW